MIRDTARIGCRHHFFWRFFWIKNKRAVERKTKSNEEKRKSLIGAMSNSAIEKTLPKMNDGITIFFKEA